jgi:phosphopantetheinyl transferase
VVSSIRCRYASVRDLPAGHALVDRWLSAAERETWQRIRSSERHDAWLAGRWLAKRVLSEYLPPVAGRQESLSPQEIDIRSRSADKNLGERPRVFLAGVAVDWALSIAHTPRGVLVAVATQPDICLGVDLVCPDASRSESLAWCFTPAERRWLAAAPENGRAHERLWAMKEAVFKACQRGEGFAPQRIEVVSDPDVDRRSSTWTSAIDSLRCWRVDGQLAALAVANRGRTSLDLIEDPKNP